MSNSALILMLTVWGLVSYLTVKLFVIILRKGVDGEDDS
jgi:hypothetical protein